MNPALTVYNNVVKEFINTDFEIQTLASDCLFTEGPVWNAKEGYYLFSDITGNCVYKIEPGKPKEVFISNSGTDKDQDPYVKTDQRGSNALAYDHDGNLLVCQHGGHGIAKFDGTRLQPFINSYQGRPFNSPNDFILHPDGRLWFSDPPYGLKDGQRNPEKFQPIAGVYCWKDGALEMICDKYKYPNGVCLSPDHKLLYICSNKPFEKFVSLYNADNNQYIKTFIEENSDGIEPDRRGNIYLCNKDGLIIVSPEGERLALIQLPTIPANICWGGPDLNDLFVTARQNVFLISNLQSPGNPRP